MSEATIQQRPSFPDLLRNWRKSRRLSQGELALEAEVSQRHLSFLESGRSAPSREMVMQLANSLGLPLREKNALLDAAGFAKMYSHKNIDAAELTQAKRAIEVLLKHHEPYPAVVIDRNWNLVMMNDANARVFGEFIDPIGIWTDIGGTAPNIARLVLHPKGLRQYISDWQPLADYFLRNLQQEVEHNPYNTEAAELIREFKDYPGMTPRTTSTEALLPLLEITAKKDELTLKMFTVVSTFGTPQDVTLQELRIETFFPADEATEQFLRKAATT